MPPKKKRTQPKSSKPKRWPLWAGLLALIGFLVFHAYQFNYISDDAFISFRYARHLAAGHGLVYNLGERVEGYTNFLWVVFLALGIRLGLDGVVLAQAAGLLLAGLSLGVVLLLSRSLSQKSPALDLVPVLWTAAFAPFALWALGGLETPLFTFLVLLAAWCDLRNDFHPEVLSPVLYALACLTRPDGLLFFAVSWMVKSALAKKRGHLLRSIATTLGPFLALTLPYFVWRYWYYGYPLPNTYYAKGGDSLAVYLRGLQYLLAFFKQYLFAWLLVPAAIVLGFYRKLQPGVVYLAAATAAYFLFIVKFGGDELVMYRFLVPVIPFICLLCSEALLEILRRFRAPRPRPIRPDAVWALAAGLALLTWLEGRGGPMRFRVDREKESFEQARVIGQWLQQNYSKQTTIAVILAGIVPYYTDFHTIDMLGLTDAHIAHSPGLAPGSGEPGHEKFDTDYVLANKPDLIFPDPVTLYDHEISPDQLYSYYGQFWRWAPGNPSLLHHPLLRQNYRIARANIGSGFFYFFQRVH